MPDCEPRTVAHSAGYGQDPLFHNEALRSLERSVRRMAGRSGEERCKEQTGPSQTHGTSNYKGYVPSLGFIVSTMFATLYQD
jgi:hypothetical protein